MEFAKLSAPSLKELFVREVETMILSGRLQVGDRLPPERELADTMQVSRAVVNAGVKEMAAKGFLEVQPRVGITVADFRRNGTVETMLSIMKYNGNRLRSEEVRSMLEIKLVLDTLAARLAVPQLTPEALGLLRRHYAAMQTAGTPEGMARETFAFYLELTLISGNTLLPLMYNSFRVPVLNLWTQFIRKRGPEAISATVSGLLDALEGGDAETAVARVQQTINGALAAAADLYTE